jgi:hypothetical protein
MTEIFTFDFYDDQKKSSTVTGRDPVTQMLTKLPPSTKSRIIFPYHTLLNEFYYSPFKKSWIKNHLNFSEIDLVLSSLKTVRAYKAPKLGPGLGLSLIFIPFVVLVFLLVSGFARKHSFLTVMSIFGGSFGLTLGITIMISRVLTFRVRKRIRVLAKILKSFNRKLYMAKGILWKVGPAGAWIELRIFKNREELAKEYKRTRRRKRRGLTLRQRRRKLKKKDFGSELLEAEVEQKAKAKEIGGGLEEEEEEKVGEVEMERNRQVVVGDGYVRMKDDEDERSPLNADTLV